MESARFDNVLRALALGRSRRATIGAALGSLVGAGSLVVLGDDAAAKKHKKKKKKKCKGGTKKCGKKCIPAASCCSSANCGNGGACVNGTCNCLSGFKSCNGACIAEDQCCGGCPGAQTCEGGTCLCPDGFPPCPDGSCVTGGQCCSDADCGGTQSCDDGFCVCPDSDQILCGQDCCESSDDQICNFSTSTCQGGGCVANDWCNSEDFYYCANSSDASCVCLSTADPVPQTACVDYLAVANNANCALSCTNSNGCPSGSVCVPGNASPGGFCECDNNFCAPLCDSGTNRRAARQDRSLTEAQMRGWKQRRR